MKDILESDQTKLALIQQSLATMNGSMSEMKADLKEIKNSHLPISVYNDFKIEYEKFKVSQQAEFTKMEAKMATKEEIDGVKKVFAVVGTVIITAITAALLKVIFIH